MIYVQLFTVALFAKVKNVNEQGTGKLQCRYPMEYWNKKTRQVCVTDKE